MREKNLILECIILVIIIIIFIIVSICLENNSKQIKEEANLFTNEITDLEKMETLQKAIEENNFEILEENLIYDEYGNQYYQIEDWEEERIMKK